MTFTPAQKVVLYAAFITAIGGIIAAIITKSPNIWGKNDPPPVTKTPVSFTQYDDPLGLFSIEYPSNFIVVTPSEIRPSEMTTSFVEASSLRREIPDVQVTRFAVGLGVSKEKVNDLSSANKFIIDFLTENENSDIKVHLISNEKKDNGYLMHLQETFPPGFESIKDGLIVHHYLLSEYEDDAFVVVAFFVEESKQDEYLNIINHLFSSFTWSPLKVIETFKVEK